ncbi:MAG TPA: hemerythrin domain-containing protein [Actinomycetota bacterium]|nr:hemerythrin domain-containing protein [Actinomycetota bacterium]
MATRHDSLVPLTHDHHHALAQARRLKESALTNDESDRRRATDDFINFYLGSLLRHFREEEELFFAPLVDEEDAHDLVMRALAEHLRVHARVRLLKRDLAVGKAEPTQLAELSKLLTAHVRVEERDVFPLVERLLSEDELTDLAASGRRDV